MTLTVIIVHDPQKYRPSQNDDAEASAHQIKLKIVTRLRISPHMALWNQF